MIDSKAPDSERFRQNGQVRVAELRADRPFEFRQLLPPDAPQPSIPEDNVHRGGVLALRGLELVHAHEEPAVPAHKLWLSRFFRVGKPKTIVISNGLSPMGIAVPGGIAAKLMDPNRRVVTVSGDGGFLMSVHELETARRENAPTVNLVFRDSGLGSIRWKQMAKFNRTVGTEFSNPDFADLAKAFGLRGFRVEHPSELNSILGEALESNAPCLVDVPIDYGTNPFLPSAR